MIAKVSDMSFEQYMEKNILEPTGMQSSSFLKQEVEAYIAAPHVLGATHECGGCVSSVFHITGPMPLAPLYIPMPKICANIC